MTPNRPSGNGDRYDEPEEDGTPPPGPPGDLLERAETDPEAVDLDAVFAALSDDDPGTRRRGATALRAVANDAPGRLAARTDDIATLLRSGQDDVREAALGAVRDAARSEPSDFRVLVEPLRRCLGGRDQDEAKLAGEALAELLTDDDDALASTVEEAVTWLRERGDAEHGETIRVLTALGSTFPGPVVEGLRPLLDADDPAVAANAMRILALVAEADPAAVGPVVPDAVDTLSGDDERAVQYAVELLEAVGAEDPDVLAGHVEVVADLLDSGRPGTRRGAAGVLSSVARADPVAVEPVVPALVDRLTDADRIVRRDAAYVLGVVRAEAAREPLEATREGASPELATVVDRALARLDGEDGEPPLPQIPPGEVFRYRNGPPSGGSTSEEREAVRQRRRRDRPDDDKG